MKIRKAPIRYMSTETVILFAKSGPGPSRASSSFVLPTFGLGLIVGRSGLRHALSGSHREAGIPARDLEDSATDKAAVS